MFIEPEKLQDQELVLSLEQYLESDPDREFVPVYHFAMVHADTGAKMGGINLRIGDTERLKLARGHIGYSVEPEFRGSHLSARSVKLLIPLAAQHGLNPLWITCDPDNMASRRSCELAGAELVEILEIPAEIYQKGSRHKCRYRIITERRNH